MKNFTRIHFTRSEFDNEWLLWVYNCGWILNPHKKSHPYRVNIDGEDFLFQPVGMLDFANEAPWHPSGQTL